MKLSCDSPALRLSRAKRKITSAALITKENNLLGARANVFKSSYALRQSLHRGQLRGISTLSDRKLLVRLVAPSGLPIAFASTRVLRLVIANAFPLDHWVSVSMFILMTP